MRKLIFLCLVFTVITQLFTFESVCYGQEYVKSLKQITRHEAIDYFPTWSPDGKWIAFSTQRAGGNIWKIPSAGGEAIQVTKIRSNHPRWSPDGSYIAFDVGGNKGMIVSSDGGQEIRIIPEVIEFNRGLFLCWNKKGSSIMYSAKGDIWLVELGTGKFGRIFHKEGFEARGLSFSPDEKYITADVGTAGKRKADDNVWLIPVDGGEPIVLTDLPGREGNPVFSPDGTMIAFMGEVNNAVRHIYVMTTDGKKSAKLTDHDGFNANPRWSPDGTKILFASDKAGNPDIWVMELDITRLKNALGIN